MWLRLGSIRGPAHEIFLILAFACSTERPNNFRLMKRDFTDQKPQPEDTEGEIHTISRQELLKAGWVVPVVIAINLPKVVQAQTAVSVEPEPEPEPEPEAPEVNPEAPELKPPAPILD